ncbi:PREDICTED: regulator of G-protein signaling 18 [Myotis brandtii]|uniref:regulator of G-protein signaling 18 n=1 Tax=Myotis brandtii TaxID=109478 RepID=UPI000703EF4F|nr:PREDICTED: regulator of G-protein signaling 18 [Myotis brandtii]
METSLLFFSQRNMWESKEKTFFKLMPGSAKEEASKEAKIRAKEKRNRLSLLLQKSEFHEEPQARRSAHLAGVTRVCREEAIRWGESFDKLLSHKEIEEEEVFKLLPASGPRMLMPPIPEVSGPRLQVRRGCCHHYHNRFRPLKGLHLKYCEITIQVNLDFHTKELIVKSITQPTLHSFDAAQSRVYQLMEQDSYTRFLKSDIYSDLVEGRPQRPTNLRRRSRSFTYNEFQDVKSDVAIWF